MLCYFINNQLKLLPSAIIQIILITKIQWSPNWRHVVIIIVVFFKPSGVTFVCSRISGRGSKWHIVFFLLCYPNHVFDFFHSWVLLMPQEVSLYLDCTLHVKQYWSIYIAMQSIKVRNIFKWISSITFPSIICYSDMIKTRDEH